MTPFGLFVGADWSGERGLRVKRLQVAVCGAGGDAPVLVGNPSGGPWTRPAFVHWLLERAGETRVLCGADFSFCFPWEDRQAYFPGFADDPADHAGFWELVEALCVADEGLFGGGLCDVEPFHHHFRRGAITGASYERRLRVTEALTQARGLGAAESVFNLVGARQVGKGSLAGMRLLRLLRANEGVAVWPFDPVEDARLVMVETFPTAFIRMAGGGPGKVRDRERLNSILAAFCSSSISPRHSRARGNPVGARNGAVVCVDNEQSSLPGVSALTEPYEELGPRVRGDDGGVFGLTDDMTDALITAAALRHLSPNPSLWNPPGLSDRVRRFEGWTFGIV